MDTNNLNTESQELAHAAYAAVDTGLMCFVIIAKFHGLSADPEQIKHSFALDPKGTSTVDILYIAKQFGFKAKSTTIDYEQLTKMPLPVITRIHSGEFVIVAKIENDQVLVLNPAVGKPTVFTIDEFNAHWTGETILFKLKGKEYQEIKFGLKWFLPSILKYRRLLMEVLLASLIMQILGLVTPIVIQVVIDKALVHQSYTTLDVILFGLMVAIVFETFLQIARTHVFTNTTSKMDVVLGARLFKHLLNLPLRYFEVRRVGDTISRVREVENIRRFLTGAPLTAVLDVLFIFVYIIVMFIYTSKLTFIVLLSLPFFIALSAIVTPIFRHRLDEKFNAGAESNSFLVEAVSGIQTIKSFALEPQSQKKWEHKLATYVKTDYKTSILGGVAGTTGQTIQRIFDLIILWMGARMAMAGDITVGQLIAFRMLSGQVSGPIVRLVQMWQEFQQVGISIRRLGDIFNTKTEPAVDPTKTKLPDIEGKITFENVRFRYRLDGAEAIRNFSVDIQPGMIVGIVGRSGSGKSTLAKLIQRLYIPESGKVLVDGIDLALVSPAWLRTQVGIVLQESFLFNGSVRENIAINKPAASMDEIVEVAKLAGAHEFILEMPEAYDTMVGERGTALSGGQRQRIAIARTLLTNPRILIFDEATSALDYESESIIQDNLKKICEGRTVLIIAHRLSTLRDAEEILVMDHGELVEKGSHEILLKKKGLYHYLYSQQGKKVGR